MTDGNAEGVGFLKSTPNTSKSAIMGIEDQTLGAYVAVVDRKGNNLGFVQGDFSKGKAAKIINLLRSK